MTSTDLISSRWLNNKCTLNDQKYLRCSSNGNYGVINGMVSNGMLKQYDIEAFKDRVAFKYGDRWCADTRKGVRCDRENLNEWELFKVKSIGKGEYALAGGRSDFKKYCAAEKNRIICNRPWIRGWEKFKFVE